jgi:hypothetical protein
MSSWIALTLAESRVTVEVPVRSSDVVDTSVPFVAALDPQPANTDKKKKMIIGKAAGERLCMTRFNFSPSKGKRED